MKKQKMPKGWDEKRVKKVLAHYQGISEEEQVLEDEIAAQESNGQTVITVPEELLPAIRQLIAAHKSA